MPTRAIQTLELRTEKIPRSSIIEALEHAAGHPITEEHRHYLAGEPVHCGNTLEIYQDGQWVPGRYEWSGNPEDLPTFHMSAEAQILDNTDLLRWPQGPKSGI